MTGFKGRKKAEKPVYKGITFDSLDEKYFYCWCEEMKKMSLLDEFFYQPDPFTLSHKKDFKYEQNYITPKKKEKKVRWKKQHLLDKHEYTEDFVLKFDSESFKALKPIFDRSKIILFQAFHNESYYIHLDCKPKGFGMKNMDSIFSINRKWIFEKYGVFVHKVYVEDWFKATFAPILFHMAHKRKSNEFMNASEFFINDIG